MSKKKIICILLILIVIGIIVYFITNNISIEKNENESYMNYTPQEEISDSQSRETTITLYFLDKATNKLKSESKLIDANELLKNPYKIIVQKLIEGPHDENLLSVFPENTRLIDANLANNCVILNFSEDLLNFKDDSQKFNIINSILNSLSQLNEVNSIKILINNEPHEGLDQEYTTVPEK